MKQNFKKDIFLSQNSSQILVNECQQTNKVDNTLNSSISGVVKEEGNTFVIDSNQFNGNHLANKTNPPGKNEESPIQDEDFAINAIHSTADKNALDFRLRSQVLSHMTERFQTEVMAGITNSDLGGHMIKNGASKECPLGRTFIYGDVTITSTLPLDKQSQLIIKPLSNERITRHSTNQLSNNQTTNQRPTRHNNSQLTNSRRSVNQLTNARNIRNSRVGKLRVTGRFKSSDGEQRVLFQRVETEKRCTEI